MALILTTRSRLVDRSLIICLTCVVASIVGLCLSPDVAAQDLIVSRTVLEDKGGARTIADVTGQQFNPIGAIMSEGYSDSAYWLRLQVRAPSVGNEVVLHIGPALLDEVRLYEAGERDPKEWITRVTGDRYVYEDRDRKDIALGFVVNVTKPEQTFYLRIKTTSASQITVQGLEPAHADRKLQHSKLFRNIFIGLMLWALVWAIDHYIVGREPIVGFFALYQGISILYGLGVTGNLAPLAPHAFPQLADLLTNILAYAVPFTFLLFSRAVLKPYASPSLQGFTVLLLAFPIQLMATALGYTLTALSMATLVSVAAAWYCVILALKATQEHVPSRRLLQTAYIVTGLIATLFGLTDFGWITLFTVNATNGSMLLTGGVVSSGLFCIMLFIRLRQSRLNAQQSSVTLELSQRALEIERAHKTKAQEDARTDYLTGLFNRRHFVELAEHELTRAAHCQEPLSLLIMDIDHFKVINDTWGHHGGDKVLRRVAHLISNALREGDILGRIGGEEFAAALIGTDKEHALEVAHRIRSTVENTAITLLGNHTVHVTLSIGLTQLGKPGCSLDDLLQEADKALYRAKDSGRNTIMAT
ncbi:MAG TPA: diguanylate cyclase [Candidimonas sp.]|nr:diguanylate cyclase [Candidimonas sp.]